MHCEFKLHVEHTDSPTNANNNHPTPPTRLQICRVPSRHDSRERCLKWTDHQRARTVGTWHGLGWFSSTTNLPILRASQFLYSTLNGVGLAKSRHTIMMSRNVKSAGDESSSTSESRARSGDLPPAKTRANFLPCPIPQRPTVHMRMQSFVGEHSLGCSHCSQLKRYLLT